MESLADDLRTLSFAMYKGVKVAVYRVDKAEITLSRKDLVELINLKELNHDNIEGFAGACIEPGNICYLMQCCSRGNVEDIVKDDEIKLDWFFKLSLINDLVNGMIYLHKSVFESHGYLSSANCHVDNKWVLKISGFALHAFRKENYTEPVDQYAFYHDQLWTAPELLRMTVRPVNGTQTADVYSFAIVIQEIVFRSEPYFVDLEHPRLIIERVRDTRAPFYRPPLPQQESAGVHPDLLNLMKQCWHEDPAERPSFHEIAKTLKSINKGRSFDVMDSMLHKLEKYADSLEHVVQQRTADLMDEKRKTDMLLYRMLPPYVADELKAGRSVTPQVYASTTICFSDIVAFTELASESSPIQVVELLNELYNTIDDTISRHDVYKVETIGDAYMVVSGLPKPNDGQHIFEISSMALELLEQMSHFTVGHCPNETLKLRIGLHSGPCAAGVVGHAMPRYCLFGDTVNVASRMQSTGKALTIHMSENAHDALKAFPEFITEPRGEISVKGKGLMNTFWLIEKCPSKASG